MFERDNKPLQISSVNNPQGGYFKQIRQFQMGAGTNVVKGDSAGFFVGGSKFSSAPFSVDFDGALKSTGATISGAITATSGSITGDLTVSGSLQVTGVGDYSTKFTSGEIQFYDTTNLRAWMRTSTGADTSSVIVGTGNKFIIAKYDGTPLISVDQSANIICSQDAYISWPSGRKLTATASKVTANGDFEVTGSFVRNGSSGVNSATFTNGDGDTVTVLGGIITDIS